MGPWEAAILGVVQGLTEFLPVSSSGHLVIFQHVLGMREPELLFDVAAHVGTLLAVLVVFRSAIAKAVGGFFSVPAQVAGGRPVTWDAGARVAWLVILGTLPTGILGLLIEHRMEWAFASLPLVSAMLAVTGAILWLTRRAPAGGVDASRLTVKQGLVMGVVQGLAAIPGISRSGSTIAAGLLSGMDRPTAARMSFLLFIPAIAGATLLTALKAGPGELSAQWPVLAIGAVSAAATGYAALKLLLNLLTRGLFHWFAVYCWLVSAGGFAAVMMGY